MACVSAAKFATAMRFSVFLSVPNKRSMRPFYQGHQGLAAAVIDAAEDRMQVSRFILFEGEVHAPHGIARQRVRHAMLDRQRVRGHGALMLAQQI